MLSEINAVTQLLLVLQVGYLTYHCRAFKNGIPTVLESVDDRDRRNLENTNSMLTILDDIADGIHNTDDPDSPVAPFNLKSLLTDLLLTKMNTGPEHGSKESERQSGEIHEVNPPKEIETEV